MAQLLLRESGKREEPIREVELGSGETTLGRAPDCDLPLANHTVSRRHASLVRTSQGYVLTDLGSVNGTWINGERVTRQLLRHEDFLCFGGAVAVFHDPPDPDATLKVDVRALLEQAHRTAAIHVSDVPERVPPGTTGAGTSRQEPTAVEPPPEVASQPPEAPAASGPPATDATGTPAEAPSFGDQQLRRTGRVSAEVSPAPRGIAPHPVPAVGAVAERCAGFWIRTLAWLIDGVILAVLGFLLTFAVGLVSGSLALQAPAIQSYLVPLATGVGVILPVAYLLVGWARWGRTPGKRLCGLRIVRSGGAPLGMGGAFVRLLGYCLSSVLLGLGFLMVAFTDRKRGLHDMIAGTVVIDER